ncbi:MAG: RHS repeat-associated core domain-containing protein, partial [Akkermansiaceae bacterium]
MWGKRVKLFGTLDTEVGYTGHHHHAKSELILTWYRAYDTILGRWLRADPLYTGTGEMAELLPEGPNLYAYVGNDAMNKVDPLGLNYFELDECFREPGGGGAGTCSVGSVGGEVAGA